MTADQLPHGRVPWRVKTRVGRSTWFGPAMTEAEAVRAAEAQAQQLAEIRDGASMIRVPTRYGVDAFVRGRDVVSIEPVGPRWDGLDDNDRPERPATRPDPVPTRPELVPSTPDDTAPVPTVPVGSAEDLSDGTAWLRRREQAAASRQGGRRWR